MLLLTHNESRICVYIETNKNKTIWDNDSAERN